MKRRLRAALVFTLVVVASSATAQSLQIENAWVRAMPPNQKMTAAYLDIRNSGENAVEIKGARSSIASRSEVHTSLEIDGYMRMKHLDQLVVGPGETLAFSPGGIHVMLMGIEKMPALGSDSIICLVLAAGGEICATATVRKSFPGVQSQPQ